MKELTLAALATLALAIAPALAADPPTKATSIAQPEPPWDFAFGSAIASDYIFRGVTQSQHKPSVAMYFEPRYNVNKDLQLYAGLGGASINFPNHAAGEVDVYGGIRPTFGKISFDFGAWLYWYPGGQCFNAAVPSCSPSGGIAPVSLPNGNTAKADVTFWELYGKVNYAVTDSLGAGAYVYYSPNVANSGAPGVFFGGNVKYTFPALSNGMQWYSSADAGHWSLGTSDAFYGCTIALGCLADNPRGIPFKDYTTWNFGIGWTWKVFTVDLRYTDTDLNKGDCNAFTSDHTAAVSTAFRTAINSGNGSNWCGARFVARLSADLTVNTNLK